MVSQPKEQSHFLAYKIRLNPKTGKWEVVHASGHIVAIAPTRNEAKKKRKQLRSYVGIIDTQQP